MTKKALLIGINYLDTRYKLNGCFNDVQNWNDYLVKKGYHDIIIMTDEQKNKDTALYPSSNNIEDNLRKFIPSSIKGDTLVFAYSGHGGGLPDYSGDEIDFQDECIYGCDIKPIIDDKIREILSLLPDGVSLRIFLDCCNSGSGCDLPYRYNRNIIFTEAKPLNKDIISISGCRDDQTSADAYIGFKFQGALTHTLLNKLKSSVKNWKSLIDSLQYSLKTSGYTQVPQLSYSLRSHPIKFIDL